MVPPYSASLHRLRHPMFEFVLFLSIVIFVFLFMITYYYFCPSISAFPMVCVVVAPPAGHRNAGLFFRALCRCIFLFFSFFLAFRLVLSCRPSVGPSPRLIVGLVVPADMNLAPSGLGLRLVGMHEVYCFVFLSFCYGNVRT